nr:hypothetical protein [Tanacetum cinerariifolium]
MGVLHDLSYIGLEEFTGEPALETLNATTSEDLPKVVKKDNGAPIIDDWNMSYRTDYEEINGGYVAFRGNPKGGKITAR